MPCAGALPDFIISSEEVNNQGFLRMVSSAPKPGRVIAKCLNCGVYFTINKAEYCMRTRNSEQPGLFHVRKCMDEYRETHKTANGMKQRILEINKRGKQ
jgi:hypothetical protein